MAEEAEGEVDTGAASLVLDACSVIGGCILENHSSIIRWMLCGLLGGNRGWAAVATGAGGEPESNLGFTDTTTEDERDGFGLCG